MVVKVDKSKEFVKSGKRLISEYYNESKKRWVMIWILIWT